MLFSFSRRPPLGRVALRFQFLQMPEAGLKFLVDVDRHDNHLLDNFLLEIKFHEQLL